MLTVETKLAQWRTFYGELCQAELLLREAQARQPSGSAGTAELEGEVRLLQQRCNEALDAVGAALAARRPHAADADRTSAVHPA
jgi:hypothetical protein